MKHLYLILLFAATVAAAPFGSYTNEAEGFARRTLEQWMQSKGLGTCARQLVKEMAGVKSVDVIVPVRRAALRTQLRLRVVTTPEPALAQVLGHLGLRPPQGSRLIGDVVPKIGVR